MPGNLPGILPRQTVLVDQQPHQLGHGDGRVGVVELHGEAASVFAGTGRFDGGVQGEQVGLVGDVRDHVHDAPDGLGPAAELTQSP